MSMHGISMKIEDEVSPTCFGRQIRPSSGALFDYIYSFWYNAPTLLPTGATVQMELTFHLNRGTGCCILLVIYIDAHNVMRQMNGDGLFFFFFYFF
jgi:hypothetical protein